MQCFTCFNGSTFKSKAEGHQSMRKQLILPRGFGGAEFMEEREKMGK